MKLLFLLLTGAYASYTHTAYINTYGERMLTPSFTTKNTATRVSLHVTPYITPQALPQPNHSPYPSPSKSPSPRQVPQYQQETVSAR